MGIAFKTPLADLRECVSILRRLLAGERLDFHGERFHLDGVQLEFAPQDRCADRARREGTARARPGRRDRRRRALLDPRLAGSRAPRARARRAPAGIRRRRLRADADRRRRRPRPRPHATPARALSRRAARPVDPRRRRLRPRAHRPFREALLRGEDARRIWSATTWWTRSRWRALPPSAGSGSRRFAEAGLDAHDRGRAARARPRGADRAHRRRARARVEGDGDAAEVRRPHPDLHRGHDVPDPLRAAGGHPADGAPVRAARLRLGVGQRPHDDPALRAARVPRAAELLRAAHHVHLRGRAHDAPASLHRHPRPADAPHGGRRQAGGDARSALRRARDPRRRHRRLPRGVRGALPRREGHPPRRRSSTRGCARCACSSPSGARPSAAATCTSRRWSASPSRSRTRCRSTPAATTRRCGGAPASTGRAGCRRCSRPRRSAAAWRTSTAPPPGRDATAPRSTSRPQFAVSIGRTREEALRRFHASQL